MSMSIMVLVPFFLLNMAVQAQNKPEVLILATGGTIASLQGSPSLSGESLTKAIPALDELASITVVEFSQIGSSAMTPTHWRKMCSYIQEYIEAHPHLGCIVITHGTDTMEETAFLLHLTHQSIIPIILVGSMRSADEISADGPANLINAVRVGIDPASRNRGVMAVLNENIISGRDLQKHHNRRADSFRSGEFGYLGSVDPDGVRFYRSLDRPLSSLNALDIPFDEPFPKVEIMSDFTGLDEDILAFFLKRDVDGLVIQTFAGGRASPAIRKTLRNHQPLPFPVVIASQLPEGRIIGDPIKEKGVIISHHFTAKKARILLMMALATSMSQSDIQELFESK
ncbi:MAG: asparaginase [Saprospiraceae bacterium]|nr:asparaginase [Saprospiraceae bacterium]